MAGLRIISTVELSPSQREAVREASGGADLTDKTCRSPDEIAAMVSADTDILLTFRMPDDLISRAPGLKWVQLLSAGADHALGGPHGGPLRDATFPVTTSSGIHATQIAEYTIASMLTWAHRMHLTMRAQIKGEWMRSGRFMQTVEELRGNTLGVIGYGSIGRETARLAQAFGMEVLALKRNPQERRDAGWYPTGIGDPEGTIPRKFYGAEGCADLLSESDFVTVTLPRTPHTHHFVGAREIAAMRPNAYIVNVGRGDVIDEAALTAALSEGKIGGAGLDVFEHEPLDPDSPLWKLENVILTPHMSGAVRDYMDKACELFAENLRRFSTGRPLLNVIDPALGY